MERSKRASKRRGGAEQDISKKHGRGALAPRPVVALESPEDKHQGGIGVANTTFANAQGDFVTAVYHRGAVERYFHAFGLENAIII